MNNFSTHNGFLPHRDLAFKKNEFLFVLHENPGNHVNSRHWHYCLNLRTRKTGDVPDNRVRSVGGKVDDIKNVIISCADSGSYRRFSSLLELLVLTHLEGIITLRRCKRLISPLIRSSSNLQYLFLNFYRTELEEVNFLNNLLSRAMSQFYALHTLEVVFYENQSSQNYFWILKYLKECSQKLDRLKVHIYGETLLVMKDVYLLGLCANFVKSEFFLASFDKILTSSKGFKLFASMFYLNASLKFNTQLLSVSSVFKG